MSELVHFWRWLWGDWGKPDYLTRLGIPRIITRFFVYLLVPYLSYLSMRAYSSDLGNRVVYVISHRPLLLFSYAVFYVSVVTGQYLEYTYGVASHRTSDKFTVIRQSWKDPIVKIFWLSLLISLGALLIGGLQIAHQAKQTTRGALNAPPVRQVENLSVEGTLLILVHKENVGH